MERRRLVEHCKRRTPDGTNGRHPPRTLESSPSSSCERPRSKADCERQCLRPCAAYKEYTIGADSHSPSSDQKQAERIATSAELDQYADISRHFPRGR